MSDIARCPHCALKWPHLTHWDRVTYICVSNLTITGSDNGLSPGRRQAIIWTSAAILLIEPLGTNFSESLIEMHTSSFKEMHLKRSSAKWRPFCLGLNRHCRFTRHQELRGSWPGTTSIVSHKCSANNSTVVIHVQNKSIDFSKSLNVCIDRNKLPSFTRITTATSVRDRTSRENSHKFTRSILIDLSHWLN